mmetsp:Transcript_26470/g.76431  ORF Transcript_26470/g.76431 Transcript_26470/m.76431 type:complete len:268 (+) Transcript_26470:243-1046(+)
MGLARRQAIQAALLRRPANGPVPKGDRPVPSRTAAGGLAQEDPGARAGGLRPRHPAALSAAHLRQVRQPAEHPRHPHQEGHDGGVQPAHPLHDQACRGVLAAGRLEAGEASEEDHHPHREVPPGPFHGRHHRPPRCQPQALAGHHRLQDLYPRPRHRRQVAERRGGRHAAARPHRGRHRGANLGGRTPHRAFAQPGEPRVRVCENPRHAALGHGERFHHEQGRAEVQHLRRVGPLGLRVPRDQQPELQDGQRRVYHLRRQRPRRVGL